MHSAPGQMQQLAPGEALRLLGSVPIGRVAFTMRALPAIRPVNHHVVEGDVIMRCHSGAALLAVAGQVVAFEADDIDTCTHEGWSVIATGKAELLDGDDAAVYDDLPPPWVDRNIMHTIRIRPEFITGYHVDGDGSAVRR